MLTVFLAQGSSGVKGPGELEGASILLSFYERKANDQKKAEVNCFKKSYFSDFVFQPTQ